MTMQTNKSYENLDIPSKTPAIDRFKNYAQGSTLGIIVSLDQYPIKIELNTITTLCNLQGLFVGLIRKEKQLQLKDLVWLKYIKCTGLLQGTSFLALISFNHQIGGPTNYEFLVYLKIESRASEDCYALQFRSKCSPNVGIWEQEIREEHHPPSFSPSQVIINNVAFFMIFRKVGLTV